MLEKGGFYFSKFREVEQFLVPNEAGVDINNKTSKRNSGTDETMQNVLASIFLFFRILKEKGKSLKSTFKQFG